MVRVDTPSVQDPSMVMGFLSPTTIRSVKPHLFTLMIVFVLRFLLLYPVFSVVIDTLDFKEDLRNLYDLKGTWTLPHMVEDKPTVFFPN